MGVDTQNESRQRSRSRSLDLSSMVLTKGDLRKISKVFEDCREECVRLSDSTRYSPEFTVAVKSANSMVTESDGVGVLDDNDVIDTHKTRSIEFKLKSYSPKRFISVMIQEGSFRSSVHISGDDPSWVDAVTLRLNEVFSSISPQSAFYIKYRSPIKHALRLACGYTLSKLMQIFLDVFVGAESVKDVKLSPGVISALMWLSAHKYVFHAINIINYYLMGAVFAGSIIKYMDSLYPFVEFSFGPEHLQKAKAERNGFYIVICAILLPIVVNLVSELVGKVLKG